MSTVEDVEAAAEQLNGYELEGRQMRVNAGPPPPRNVDSYNSRGPSSGRSMGGGGGGGRSTEHRLHVSNLSWGVDDLSLKSLFSEHGDVVESRVIYDRESSKSRGFWVFGGLVVDGYYGVVSVCCRFLGDHSEFQEVELSMQRFNQILKSANGVCLYRQIMFAASEGIQKGQKVMNRMSRSAELIKIKTSEAATEALNLIMEALLICPHSETLLEMKAKTLCLLRKYIEAIQLCEQSFAFAEKNFAGDLPKRLMEGGSGCPDILDVKSWRQDMVEKCHFHLGRLDFALGRLQKQGRGTNDQDLLHPLAATIRELQKRKNAGNEALQSGKHAEAVVHYTSAISSSTESRPFAVICFYNRAAAYQALGQITTAIADCCLAIALDENYPKALSRRATLHEMIRDYNQAADDLQKLVSILEKKALDKEESGLKSDKELRQVRRRLSNVESEAKKGIPLDLYLILGVKRSDPAAEIKKAYRKAALRHHPDKACQALVRSESGDDGQLWKDIADLVHKDSDKLFKIIGEAYQVLSDPEKRSEYDLGEDMRNKKTDVYRNSPRRDSSTHNMYSPFTRSSTRRHSYKTYYWSYDDD